MSSFMSSAAEAQSIPLLQMTNPSTADTIQDTFLSCPICYDVYRQPKCLPCLHTFCCHCLISYMQSQEVYGARRKRGFPCPVCKQFIQIENHLGSWSEWAEEFRNNFLIQNMIDTILQESDQGRTETEDGSTEDSATKVATPSAPTFATPSARPFATPSARPFATPSAPPASFDIDSATSSMFESVPQQLRYRPRFNPRPDSPDHPSGVFYGRQNSTSMPDLNQGSHSPARNTNAISAFASRSATVIALPASNTPVSYTETSLRINKTYEMAARSWSDYKPPRICDICCLPKQNSVLVIDYDNRCVKFIKDVFLGRNVTTSSDMVLGRPCCLAILDEASESHIVVSILNRSRLYFMRVPELEVVNIMETSRPYRGVAALNRDTILAASPGDPSCVDIIHINQSFRLRSCTTIYRTGNFEGSWNYDIYQPNFITVMSPTTFAVSDAQRKSLVFFQIEGRRKAVKKFTLTPPEHQRFREPAGLCYHNDSMYIVDKDNHEVNKVTFGATVVCETVLKQRDGVLKPSSICVGPRGELCVSNWEGKVTIFTART
ncbi:uncharacterized protein LOC124133371 [Haliotis rufescens]|uniref:uncharacterized protein LOC124133371 n=1 Tax=Haliotis rufescens TaxID=6454 RepID=UPI00201FAE14|nr:uncharacterized protein LOC124133371 [Haliotis rufescens]